MLINPNDVDLSNWIRQASRFACVCVLSFHSYSNKHDNALKNVPRISMATGIQQQQHQQMRYANAQSTATT